MSANPETYAFQAEINQLLSLIINAFYSNKEIFLRELISNASDAIDKIRYLSLTNKDELAAESKLEIRIVPDKENKVLVIEDTGIGMTKKDLIENLGTIAKSGTKSFMEALTEGKADLSLIGQFGVGFYSAYLVADRVRVVTKHNSDSQYTWESTAGGSFTITPSEEPNLPRGTRIYLYMKDDQTEFLETFKLQEIVKKHNGFINFPVLLQIEREVEIEDDEVPADKNDEKKDDEGEVEEVKEEPKEPKPKRTEKRLEFEQVNTDKPLWVRPHTEITDDEYKSFYKSLTGEWTDPLAWKHFQVEGSLEFRGLLYIPEHPPHELYERTGPRNIKLYVRRVFIMDDCKELIPDWLAFIRGVVDSDDLPLNISREMLQQNRIMKQIQKNIVKRVLEMLSDMSDNDQDKFKKFYTAFHKSIKLGVHDDRTHREKLIDLIRYPSTNTNGDDDMVTFKQYIDRMKEGQKNIYFITGESMQAVKESPFLETLKRKGYEVLLMTDPIDEYMMQQVHDYKDHKFVCISKDIDLVEQSDEEKEQHKKIQAEYRPLCDWMKTAIGEDRIMRVQVSNRLVNTPCVIVTDKYGWTANMERIMKAQALSNTTQHMWAPMSARKVLEINPQHKFIQHLFANYNNTESERANKDLAQLLFESALLHSGFAIQDPNSFVKRIHRMIGAGLSLEEDDDADSASNASAPLPSNEVTEPSSLEEVD